MQTRRDFLRDASGTLTAAGLATALSPRAHAAEDHTLRVALIGCGGRGTGAAVNALSTAGPTRLVALADVFADRVEAAHGALQQRFPDQVDVPAERRFTGFSAFRQAVAAVGPGGVVLLATPPAFRPQHVEHAVAQGRHVFMEKSFAVDGPGIRRVLAAGRAAEASGLKIAGGLMSRHYLPLEQAVARIHEGALGEIITCWAYRMHQPVGFKARRPGEAELAHQIRNYSCYTWLNGSFLLDWLIHNLDICCWIKGAWPVSAQGQGGRQVREEPDQLFDHYAVEYSFPDGTRLLAQGRHMGNCWGFFGDVIHGATGSAVLGEGVPQPRLFRGHQPTAERQIWSYDGPRCNAYQREHDLFFAAIRENRPYNETERCAQAALTGILGRMAVEGGQPVTRDQALASTRRLAPGLDDLTWDSAPPVAPDPQGHYPIAMPGRTEVL